MAPQPPLSDIPHLAEDAMFGLSAAYRADQDPQKVDLGVGAYRDEHGQPWILPSVRQAEERIPLQDGHDHEYLPIAGHSEYLDASAQLVFGQGAAVLSTGRVATVQTLSGTGALHLGAALLAEFLPSESKTAYLSSPPYVNHEPIFSHVGFRSAKYPYYLLERKGLDMQGMLATLDNMRQGSLVVLHACAHNPTGADPSRADWEQVCYHMQQKKHIPFFDLAYQGFATGDAEADAWVIRHFVHAGFETLLVSQSYAKNFGLYGERVGCLHVLVPDSGAAERVSGQLKKIQRREVSTPPLFGARIVSTILNDSGLREQWKRDLHTMSSRLEHMRKRLRFSLEAHAAAPGKWIHLTEQKGMFCYTGLSEAQVALLRAKHHIYMTKDGRISVSGLNNSNIERTARAIHEVCDAVALSGFPGSLPSLRDSPSRNCSIPRKEHTAFERSHTHIEHARLVSCTGICSAISQ